MVVALCFFVLFFSRLWADGLKRLNNAASRIFYAFGVLHTVRDYTDNSQQYHVTPSSPFKPLSALR